MRASLWAGDAVVPCNQIPEHACRGRMCHCLPGCVDEAVGCKAGESSVAPLFVFVFLSVSSTWMIVCYNVCTEDHCKRGGHQKVTFDNTLKGLSFGWLAR